ncbi:hypothetical protein F2P56_004602 [Juglans regia]|uniref:Uncharacterized protein LOC109021703 n=2 Tax=Juglans regia TaxID=51240 RepID=A0A2I4HUW3_JUGRE|nr:uncharacterized protein LOC109021703 [Juglans regia]KAF5478005.1 hypothetical protein F2P56_004602 [Juglans regia]
MAMLCDLKDRFSQANGPRIFQLQKTIACLTQDNLTVSAYFTQMKGLWDELLNYIQLPSCSCGALQSLSDLQQQDYVMCFLIGLNDRYSHIRGQILLIDHLPPINKVLSLILQEERQRDIGSFMIPSIPSAALSSSSIGKPSAGSRASIRKDRPLCSHYGLQGHTVDKCFKLHGYPRGCCVKARSSTPYANQAISNDSNLSLPLSHTQCQQLLALLNPAPTHQAANTITSSLPDHLSGKFSFNNSVFSSINKPSKQFSDNDWIIDTGATDHMVHSISLFTSYQPVHNTVLKLPNGTSAHDLIHWRTIGRGQAKEGLYLLQPPPVHGFVSQNVSSDVDSFSVKPHTIGLDVKTADDPLLVFVFSLAFSCVMEIQEASYSIEILCRSRVSSNGFHSL